MGQGVRDFEGTRVDPSEDLGVLSMPTATGKVNEVLLEVGEQNWHL